MQLSELFSVFSSFIDISWIFHLCICNFVKGLDILIFVQFTFQDSKLEF